MVALFVDDCQVLSAQTVSELRGAYRAMTWALGCWGIHIGPCKASVNPPTERAKYARRWAAGGFRVVNDKIIDF